MSKYISLDRLQQFWNGCKAKFFPFTGGEINGDVKIDGDFTLAIPDDDYDAGVRFTKTLDNNLGVVLTATGFANGNGSNTNYRPVFRGIGTPRSSYDVANKQYVDEQAPAPTGHIVWLNLDGTIDDAASTLVYSTIKANLTDPKKTDYLDCLIENGQATFSYTRFRADAVGITDVNVGDVVFTSEMEYLGTTIYWTFALDNQSELHVVSLVAREQSHNKVQDVLANSGSTVMYPSTKAVYDFVCGYARRKPDVVYETDGTTGLLALGADDSANVAWQLSDIDLTPYKRVKIHAKSNGSGSSELPALVLEILLDARGANANTGNYVGSSMFQNPNNSNRLGTLTCSISSDKTKFAVLRMNSIYGTAATSNTGTNAYVYMIEGYYD